MKPVYSILLLSGIMALFSCQKQSDSLTAEENKLIIDSTTQIIQKLIDADNKNFKFDSSSIALIKSYYSADPDIRHIGHGRLITSLNAMIDSMAKYSGFRETVEYFEEKPDRMDVVILSSNAVSITVPCEWKMKVIGLPEYNGTEVMSFILQKRDGRWMIIQSHISDPNICEAIAALMPPKSEVAN
jgi:uncharacterized membrane protein YvbJ